jgi:phosphoglycerate dehydrogenase-like enzyme
MTDTDEGLLGLLGLSNTRSQEILVVDFDAKAFKQIKKAIPEVVYSKYPRDAAVIALIWSKLDLDRLPSLKYVINAARGVNHLEVGRFSQAGVTLLEIPPYCTEQVADYTVKAVQRTNGDSPRVAVVGMGEIGRAVEAKLRALGATVLPIHHNSSEEEIQQALSTCTHVSLHLPLTEGTKKWLSAKRLSYLKGAVVINTARAAEVDEKALLVGLRSGAITHAYLDVFRDWTFLKEPNVTCTRHIAWKSPQSEQLRVQYTVERLKEARDAILTHPT